MSGTSQRIDPLLGFNFLVSITDSQPAASSALAQIALSLTATQQLRASQRYQAWKPRWR